jgi:GT2 family glycosyltransferase/glycosyltransferase involved in cell wall biosynthesis
MKINFCVNTTGNTGGIRVIFIYANFLVDQGHEVNIIYPYNLTKKWFSSNSIKAFLKWLKYDMFKKNGTNWFPLKAKVLRVPTLIEKYIPNADVVIATANETADWVSILPIEKGEKFYFIQGYETWTRNKEMVENTYRMPFKKIVISSWLKKMIVKKNSSNIYGPVTNGVNFKQFYNNEKKFNHDKKILMIYSPLKIKGFQDGLKAFNIAKSKHPEIKLTIFSIYPKNDEIPDDSEFYYQPSLEKIRELYATSDIFVSSSWQEGCQLPPMEAMACKCAVVATNVGGIPDYAISNKTAMVVEPKNPYKMALSILELIENETKLKEISLNGYEHIKEFTWEKATKKFEDIIKSQTFPELIQEPKVGIIVLNWNQKKVTEECISSLQKINYQSYKIFLVDNASTDGSMEYLKNKFGTSITYIQNEKNFGYAEGNNKGIQEVIKKNFDYILIMNNDVQVDKNFLTELVKVSNDHSEIGLVSPKVYYPGSEKKLQSVGGKIKWSFGEARLIGNLEKDKGQYDTLSEIDFASGVCVLAPTEIFQKVGMIPTDYYMYGEDVDWSFRIKKAEYKIVVVPQSIIYHFDSLSSKSDSPAKTYYYFRNCLIFMKKWASWLTWIYFIPCFAYKIIKMDLKYLITGKFSNIKSIIIAKFNFLKGEVGENKKYNFANQEK